jgi:U3 small nucleolar RNA-associated protein 10
VLYENLDATNSYLSLPIFLDVIDKLLGEGDPMISKKSMFMLQERLKVTSSVDLKVEQFSIVTDSLIAIFSQEGGSLDVLENKQYSMICLAVLVTMIGDKSLEKYTNILQIIIGKDGLLHEDIAVYSSSMVSIASFIRVLGPRTIPSLPKFMPIIMKKIKNAIQNPSISSQVIIKSGLVCMDALIETIPQFMSSYLNDFVLIICDRELSEEKNDEIEKTLVSLVSKLPICFEYRILMPSLLKQVNVLIEMGPSSLIRLLSIFSEILSSTKQSKLLDFGKEWFKLFISLFDFRKNIECNTEVL